MSVESGGGFDVILLSTVLILVYRGTTPNPRSSFRTFWQRMPARIEVVDANEG